MSQTVFNNDMVAHVWAQQNQPHGRNANDSFSFSCKELISYGTTIGLYYPPKGDYSAPLVLMSASCMSNTTGKHISLGRRAVNYNTVDVDGIFSWGKRYNYRGDVPGGVEIRKALLAMILEKAKSYDARKRDSTRQQDAHAIGQLLADMLQVCNYFGIKYPKGYSDVRETLGQTAATVAKLARAKKAKEAKRAKALKIELAMDKIQFEEWLNAEGHKDEEGVILIYIACPHSFQNLDAAFLTVHGDAVHTSQGAQAPLDHVKKAFKLYRRILKSGKAWTKNGERARLGHFELDSIDAQGNAKAGCHTFTAQELERFANKWEL